MMQVCFLVSNSKLIVDLPSFTEKNDGQITRSTNEAGEMIIVAGTREALVQALWTERG